MEINVYFLLAYLPTHYTVQVYCTVLFTMFYSGMDIGQPIKYIKAKSTLHEIR